MKKTKAKKLPGFFSIHNNKFALSLAIVIDFAAGGGYRYFTESASATSKVLTTARGYMQLIHDIPSAYLRQGSTGSCVVVAQQMLNWGKYIYGTSWPALKVDCQYGPITASAVSANQQRIKTNLNGGMAVDGLAGYWTFYYFRNVLCTDLWARSISIHECR